MYLTATFQQMLSTEIAIAKIEEYGILTEDILVIPLDIKAKSLKKGDSIDHYDGKSQIDLACVLGCVFMLLGTIYGYILKWGPITWGLIGLVSGFLLGYVIDVIPKGKRTKTKAVSGMVVVMIKCKKEQKKDLVEILWQNLTLAIGELDL